MTNNATPNRTSSTVNVKPKSSGSVRTEKSADRRCYSRRPSCLSLRATGRAHSPACRQAYRVGRPVLAHFPGAGLAVADGRVDEDGEQLRGDRFRLR